jgi:hypothetical protein
MKQNQILQRHFKQHYYIIQWQIPRAGWPSDQQLKLINQSSYPVKDKNVMFFSVLPQTSAKKNMNHASGK